MDPPIDKGDARLLRRAPQPRLPRTPALWCESAVVATGVAGKDKFRGSTGRKGGLVEEACGPTK